MGFVWRGRSNRLIRVVAPLSLATLLLIASPGGASAQSAAQEQYVTQEQYSGGGVQQAPVVPGDPAYPGLTTPVPPSAPSSGPAQGNPAAQEQYSGGATGPAPSSVPPAGPVSPKPDGAGPSRVPVGPGDPAHPGPSPQLPQTFGQELADVSADLGDIGQSLAALNQGAPTTAASDPYPAAVAAFSAPTTAVVGGASPGQPPVAAVDPYSAAVNAVSAVGAGAPGYTTWGQPPSGVAVLGGPPQQDQQAPVAVVDPYSAAVGAALPSVPGETAQTALYLQQLLLLRDLQSAEQALQQTNAPQAQDGSCLSDLARPVDQCVEETLAAISLRESISGPMSPEEMSNQRGVTDAITESGCLLSRTWAGAPDGSDLDNFGHGPAFGGTDFGDVEESCNVW